MNNKEDRILLVGDNPFHGISHLSQERVRDRGNTITNAKYAADLVMTSIDNGADGFMFSVSDTTLSILRNVSEKWIKEPLSLYALVPYAYEYVRLATQAGGITGLAKRLAKEIAFSGNLKAASMGLRGIVTMDPLEIMKAYIVYEIFRIKSAAKKKGILRSVLLHEVITDMALALDLDNLFKSYVQFFSKLEIQPGFETRNFPFLVNKFREWNIDIGRTVIATPFNKIGFYMNPSKIECEKTLESISSPTVIAMSILGAGYLKPSEAADYVRVLPNISGVVVGVSKENHARETFRFLKDALH